MVRLRTFSLFVSLWVILLHMMVPHCHPRTDDTHMLSAADAATVQMDLSQPFRQVDLGYRHLELLSDAAPGLMLADVPQGIQIPLPPAISPSEWGLPTDQTLPSSHASTSHPRRGPPVA